MRDPLEFRSASERAGSSKSDTYDSKEADDEPKFSKRRFSTVALEHAALPYRASPDLESGDDGDTTIGDGDSDIPHAPGLLVRVVTNYGEGVGLFSLWRFPNMLVKHGGAFIIAYIIVACLIGLPLQQLETSVGEFTRLGPFGVWGCSRMIGIGVASIFLSILVALLSTAVTVWFMYYCFSSMASTLPWDNDGMVSSNWTWSRMPQDYHFWTKVTDSNTGFNDKPGVPEPNLILCSLALYVTVALSLSRKFDRKRTSLKLLPDLFSTVAIFGLFFTTTSRNGAMEGVESALSIHWSYFHDPWLWVDALVQMFFSFGCSTGVQALQAARRPYKAASMLALALTFAGDLLTGIIAGLTVCMALAEFSAESGDVIATIRGYRGDGSVPNVLPGPGISIVAYSYALSNLHGAPAWSTIFFAALSLTGYRTVGPCVRVVSTFLLEKMGKWESRDRIKIALFVSMAFALISAAFFTRTGPHLVCLFETFAMYFGAPFVGLAECVALCFIYGSQQWAKDLAGFTGSERSFVTAVIWKYVTPLSLLAQITICFASFGSSDEDALCAIWTFPPWVQIVGWVMACTPVFLILLHMVSTYLCSPSKHISVKELFAPSEDWSPAEETFYWLMRNLGGKYHVLPDPIVLVNLESLDPKGPLHGIPHGYAVEPEAYDSSHLHTNPNLQKRILELLDWDERRLQQDQVLPEAESDPSSPRRRTLHDNQHGPSSSSIQVTVTDSASVMRRESSAAKRRNSALFPTAAEMSRRAIEASSGSPERERHSKGHRLARSASVAPSAGGTESSTSQETGVRTAAANSTAKIFSARMRTILESDRPRSMSVDQDSSSVLSMLHHRLGLVEETKVDGHRGDSLLTVISSPDLANQNDLSTKSLPAPSSNGVGASSSAEGSHKREIIGWTGKDNRDIANKNTDLTKQGIEKVGFENNAFESD